MSIIRRFEIFRENKMNVTIYMWYFFMYMVYPIILKYCS